MPRRRVGDGDCKLISCGLATGASFAAIARSIGRPTSTISREVNRCGGRTSYRAVSTAQACISCGLAAEQQQA